MSNSVTFYQKLKSKITEGIKIISTTIDKVVANRATIEDLTDNIDKLRKALEDGTNGYNVDIEVEVENPVNEDINAHDEAVRQTMLVHEHAGNLKTNITKTKTSEVITILDNLNKNLKVIIKYLPE